MLLPPLRWGAQVLAAGEALSDSPHSPRRRKAAPKARTVAPTQAVRDFQWLAVLRVSLVRAQEVEVPGATQEVEVTGETVEVTGKMVEALGKE